MSDEHFKGKYEVELKYRVESKTSFLDVLKQMPHEIMLEDNLESDWYFDTPDKSLKQQNKSVCIRIMEPSGIKLWIVKGPEADRCEATNIADANSAKSMLQTMGYEVTLKATKTRSIYFVGKFHITVDTLNGIGDFAEFAIMTDDESMLDTYKVELENLASKFGLTDSALQTKSYKQMFLENHTSRNGGSGF
ncbi:class IV adenylate cyclase [Vibrio mexicanus]|uniref:class IV adenylate cyclase n=1 Tax=Vibrio mexicanus TaxID=1004326 RepID=UPI00063C74F9|nr:class IV adenylate cyclase [Vibrio mexicanus]